MITQTAWFLIAFELPPFMIHSISSRVYVDGSISGPTYAEIFTERIWANQPFLLVGNPCVDATGQSWKAVDCWVDGSSINTDALIHLYGQLSVCLCVFLSAM